VRRCTPKPLGDLDVVRGDRDVDATTLGVFGHGLVVADRHRHVLEPEVGTPRPNDLSEQPHRRASTATSPPGHSLAATRM
jgi:hypothetical protein